MKLIKTYSLLLRLNLKKKYKNYFKWSFDVIDFIKKFKMIIKEVMT